MKQAAKKKTQAAKLRARNLGITWKLLNELDDLKEELEKVEQKNREALSKWAVEASAEDIVALFKETFDGCAGVYGEETLHAFTHVLQALPIAKLEDLIGELLSCIIEYHYHKEKK